MDIIHLTVVVLEMEGSMPKGAVCCKICCSSEYRLYNFCFEDEAIF